MSAWMLTRLNPLPPPQNQSNVILGSRERVSSEETINREHRHMKTLTIETAKNKIGNTWFNFALEGETITMETRRHGSVYNETCGKEDIAEGKRILSKLPPATHHKRTLECVDEWVVVTISTKPFPASQIKENKRRAAFAKNFAEMKAEVESIASPRNTGSPYHLTHDEEKRHWTLSVSYGITTNPRDLQIKHKTAEQATQDGTPLAYKWGDDVSIETKTRTDRVTFSGVTTHRDLGDVIFTGSFR